VAVGPGEFVLREGLRFGAHDRRPHLRGDLHDPVDAAGEVFGFRLGLAAGLGQVLVSDTVLVEEFLQYKPIVLRPTRAGDAPHVAKELYVVLLQQFEKVRERVPPVADGVNGGHKTSIFYDHQ